MIRRSALRRTVIRPARPGDLEFLPAIETAAGQLFRTLGMDAVAEDQPPAADELADYQGDGRAWVAVNEAGQPVGYLLAGIVGANAHVDQLTVHPAAARQGLGRQLLAAVADWAGTQGLAGLTLTTYATVPWNAPYYLKLGFRTLPENELTPGLAAIRDTEAAAGLAQWPRVVMYLPLPAGG